MHVFTHEPPLSHCSWSSSEFGPLAAGRHAGNAWVVWSGRVAVRSHPGGKMAELWSVTTEAVAIFGSILRRSAYHMKIILTSISWDNFWGSPSHLFILRLFSTDFILGGVPKARAMADREPRAFEMSLTAMSFADLWRQMWHDHHDLGANPGFSKNDEFWLKLEPPKTQKLGFYENLGLKI